MTADPRIEDQARSATTLADLVAADRADPTTPDHFEVDLEPLEPEEGGPDGG